jgi:hypothetical protein
LTVRISFLYAFGDANEGGKPLEKDAREKSQKATNNYVAEGEAETESTTIKDRVNSVSENGDYQVKTTD